MAIKFHNNGNLKVTDLDETQSDIKFKDDEGLECADFEEGSGDDGLVGYWTMDDNLDTTNVIDSSGEGNHGTFSDANGNPYTSAHSVTGQVNRALEFDGIDDYVDCGNAASLDITENEITIEAWVKPIAFLGYLRIVDKTNSTGSSSWRGYALLVSQPNHYIYASFGMDGGTNAKTITPDNTVETDKWQHFFAVYNNTTKKCTLYKNGEYISGQTQTTGVGNRVNPSNHLFLGIGTSNDGPFNGLIDEVRIYNRALSAEEILLHYNNSKHRFYDTGKMSILGEIDET